MTAKNIIPVTVDSRFIGLGEHTSVVSGNIGVDFISLTLDDEWDGYQVHVTFSGSGEENTTVDFTGKVGKAWTCEIPWEQITAECDLYIGVQALNDDGDEVLNTQAMRIPINVLASSEASGADPQQPTAGTLQRVEQDILTLEQKTIPVATTSSLGGVKVGEHLSITEDGTLSVDGTRDGGDGIPVGTIMQYAAPTAPTGWLLCDGSTYSRSEYPELYAVIGVTYGQVGTRFAVPDMRDKMPVGAGGEYSLSEEGGEAAHKLTISEMPSHTHTFYGGYTGGSTTTSRDYLTYTQWSMGGWSSDASNFINATGDGEAHNNMPPYLALSFIIKAKS